MSATLADRRGRRVSEAIAAWAAGRHLDDSSLAIRLLIVALATVADAAAALVGLHGGHFDERRVEAYVRAHADAQAANLTEALRRDLHVEGALVDEVWQSFEDRAASIGAPMANSLSNFTTVEFARQDPREFVKVWHTTSDDPRPSHAALDGVGIAPDETFANGCRFPGDPEAPISETVQCQCALSLQIDAGTPEESGAR